MLSPFCGGIECEEKIKDESAREDPGLNFTYHCGKSLFFSFQGEVGQAAMGAKTLCIPLEQPKHELPNQCIRPACKETAKFFALFGRSY